MGIKRTIEIDGQQVGSNEEGSSGLDMFSLEMFENIAYIMAKHADPAVLDSPRTGWTASTPSPSTGATSTH